MLLQEFFGLLRRKIFHHKSGDTHTRLCKTLSVDILVDGLLNFTRDALISKLVFERMLFQVAHIAAMGMVKDIFSVNFSCLIRS